MRQPKGESLMWLRNKPLQSQSKMSPSALQTMSLLFESQAWQVQLSFTCLFGAPSPSTASQSCIILNPFIELFTSIHRQTPCPVNVTTNSVETLRYDIWNVLPIVGSLNPRSMRANILNMSYCHRSTHQSGSPQRVTMCRLSSLGQNATEMNSLAVQLTSCSASGMTF